MIFLISAPGGASRRSRAGLAQTRTAVRGPFGGPGAV